MGSVYLATQLAVERRVAVKILHAGFARKKKELLRFKQEARAIAALNHPNSIRLFDFGQTKQDVPYLVMEFLSGRDLSSLLEREGPLDPQRVVTMALQVFGALSEAHSKGIVHRDLKPANLFVTHITGEGETMKVLDFGIAKVQGELGSDTALTQKGTTIGSPRYMAPEQARALEIKPATDVYAMGCILYEMLTGRPVFIRNTASDYIIAHVKEDPPWPCVGQRRLEGPLIEFVLRCLEKKTEQRPRDASEAVTILRTLEGLTGIDTSAVKAVRTARRRRKSETGIFPPAARTRQRAKRLGGPLSTSQIGLAEDPTAKIPRSSDRMWWSLAAMSLVVAIVGFGALLDGLTEENPTQSSVAKDEVSASHTQANQAKRAGTMNGTQRSESPTSTPKGDHQTDALAVIHVESEPSGAHVWQGKKLLGATPLDFKLSTNAGRVYLRFMLPGHRVGQASLVPKRSLSMKVPLTRLDDALVPTEPQ